MNVGAVLSLLCALLSLVLALIGLDRGSLVQGGLFFAVFFLFLGSAVILSPPSPSSKR